MVWYSDLFHNFPQFIVIHTVKGFGIVNKAEILELSCFFDDPATVGNLISGSSVFSQSSLNICWIIEKAREFQKNTYFCFIDYAKTFDHVDHNKPKNSERDENTRPPYLPPEKSVCRQEATVRTEHGTDCFQIGKGVCQGCILSPWLFNL